MIGGGNTLVHDTGRRRTENFPDDLLVAMMEAMSCIPYYDPATVSGRRDRDHDYNPQGARLAHVKSMIAAETAVTHVIMRHCIYKKERSRDDYLFNV